MKKLILLVGLALASNGFAGQLNSFHDVKHAVWKGKSIRIAINFNRCAIDLPTTKQSMMTLGVFTPNELMINSAGNIAASLNHFTLNDVNAPGKPVYQFVTYLIKDDDSVHLSVQVLDAANYSPIAPKQSYTCKLTEGARIFSR